MDYKKKYEEALGRARAFSQRWQGIEATDSELALQELKEIFPELKESDGHYVPVRVKYIGEGNYSCESDDCKSFLSFPICNENEYVLTEQKSAWSEEDEQMLQKALSTIRYALAIPIDKEDEPCYHGSSTISWLKSIKERMKGE